MSRNILRGTLESIQSKYIIIKEGEGGTDSKIWFCLSRIHLTHENLTKPDPWALRNKIKVIKAPRGSENVPNFHKEVRLMHQLRGTRGCVDVVDTGGFPDTPWFAMPWIRGGTLWDVLDKVAPLDQAKVVPPAFIWHIIASLLNILVDLRADIQPDPRVSPVLHLDIHGNQILFDAFSSRHPPFPDVKLIDFGRARVFSRYHSASQLDQFDNLRTMDLMEVGKLLHELGHEKHTADCNRTMTYSSLEEGQDKCSCIPLPTRGPPCVRREFGVRDTGFDFIVSQLVGSAVDDLVGEDVAHLADMARDRCNESLQRAGRRGEAMDISDWDTGPAEGENPDKEKRIVCRGQRYAITGKAKSTGQANAPALSFDDDMKTACSAIEQETNSEQDMVVLVHSYGGIPGSDAVKGLTKAERSSKGEKSGVIRMAYLCAFALNAGTCILDGARRRRFTKLAARLGAARACTVPLRSASRLCTL